MLSKRVQFSVTAALATLGLCACGNGLSPGEYRIYKMALQNASKSGGCYYPNTEPDPNTRSDSDTDLTTDTWVMTADTSGDFFLDLGKTTLLGAKADSGYTFSSRKVDVQFAGDDASKTQTTTTTDTKIDTTIDGKSIGGTATVTTTIACNGTDCMGSPPSCTTSQRFSGTEVDNVDLQYTVK